MWYTYLIPPVLGAVIGYLTNEIAIRMLFRPLRPHYLFGWQLPFTPGLIPKEKGRIAHSVADAISVNLLNKETIEKTLLSDEMFSKITEGVETFFRSQSENEDSVRQYAARFLTEENVESMAVSVTDDFSKRIALKLADSNMAATIAHKVVEYVSQKMASNMGVFAMIGSAFVEPAENFLTKHLDVILKERSGEIVQDMVRSHVQDFLDSTMSSHFKDREDNCLQAKEMVLSAYKSIITDHLPKLMETIDVRRIVEERINDMDVEEMERLILQVMKKELRSIVWLGALLGGVIGLLNLLIL